MHSNLSLYFFQSNGEAVKGGSASTKSDADTIPKPKVRLKNLVLKEFCLANWGFEVLKQLMIKCAFVQVFILLKT
jgi:hypothetical protein